MNKDIIIIGGGWYGCHIASILKKYNFNITIIEKNNSIFDNSSYYNQNRLHLGYHYCRNFSTRQLCKKSYNTFIDKYNNLVDNITNNYYIISKESVLDFKTYQAIYNYEEYDTQTIKNNLFKNNDGDILITNEKVINSDKAKTYFEKELESNNIQLVLNTKVLEINKDLNSNKINIICGEKDNNSNKKEKIFTCDILLDCTYNQLQLSKQKYTYELTISLIYKKIKNVDFDAITIMDGPFSSLYPRDIENNLYTLTDVEYTPIISSSNYLDIENYEVTNEEVEQIKLKMCNKFKKYYPDFENIFEYNSYFLSKKTKQVSVSDSRDIIIEQIDNNIISVNCGKICGIFEFEEYIKKYLLI